MRLVVVMGVAGCGKSSLARALAEKHHGLFLEGDDFHPPANKQKMAGGLPLTDEDRRTWLNALHAEVQRLGSGGKTIFLACSALKKSYRERLAAGVSAPSFVYLKIDREGARRRLEQRADHFMPASLVDSQFEILQEPDDAVVLDAERPLDELVRELKF